MDWGEKLDSRLCRHDGVMHSLLSNSGSAANDSPFLREFAEKVHSGRGRTLLQASKLGSMVTLGYCGPRGERRISEFVARRFPKEVQRWAVDNWLVSVRRIMAFLYSLVVSELAVRLVMEDMKLGR